MKGTSCVHRCWMTICSSQPFACHSEALSEGWRTRALGMLRELKQRWTSVTAQLKLCQTEAMRGVTATRDVGLTALLIILLPWGDTCYPYRLVTGLPAVGTAPCYGIFRPQPHITIAMQDVLADTEVHNKNMIAKLRPGPSDEFPLSQSLVWMPTRASEHTP